LLVRYRVNEVTHQVLALGPEFVILAAEGHDLCRIASTRFAAIPVAVKAGTVDDEVSFVSLHRRWTSVRIVRS
jgi:hypothetical protein